LEVDKIQVRLLLSELTEIWEREKDCYP